MDPRKGLRPKVSLIKADDVQREAPNRRDRRALAKKLRRLRSPRTGKPWPMVRKTGWPAWKYEVLRKELAAYGIKVADTLPPSLRDGNNDKQEAA